MITKIIKILTKKTLQNSDPAYYTGLVVVQVAPNPASPGL